MYFSHGFLRKLCTAAAVKNFEDIPGPKSYPLIGSMWKYLPFIGDYDPSRLHLTGQKKLLQYGNIVKEEVAPGFFIVNVFCPEDIEQIYKSEGKYPARRSHLAVQNYRLSRPHLYNTGGLLPTNGSEWWRLRSCFQKSLSRIKDVRMFLPTASNIVDEFIVKCFKDGKIVPDFLPLIARLNLELIWAAMFGKRLGNFDPSEFHSDSMAYRLVKAAETANCCIMQTDSTENIWKVVKTPTYLKLENCLEYIERIVLQELEEKKMKLKSQSSTNIDNCLITNYLSSPEVDFKDVVGMSVDLVLGGVDTTSYTLCFLLYHLAKCENAQNLLRNEALKLLPNADSDFDSSVLNEAKYTRAILKEMFRMNPISVGISRNLAEDAVLSGYLVPKGTLIITQNMVACRQEKYFSNADKFIPERFLKESSEYSSVSPYLILPFSHGPRTCIARRLAEQNLLTITLKIFRNYKVHWLGENLGIVTPLICKPDKPVKVVFQNCRGKN